MANLADQRSGGRPAYRVGAVLVESTRILVRYLAYFAIMAVAFGALHVAVAGMAGRAWPYGLIVEVNRLYYPLAGGMEAMFGPRIVLALAYQAIAFGLVPILAMTVFALSAAQVLQEHRFRPIAAVRAALVRLPALMVVWLALLVVLVLVWIPPPAAMAVRASRVLFWAVPLCLIVTFAIAVYGWPVVGAMTVEGLGPIRGLKRGVRLGRRTRWRTVGLLSVLCLVVVGGLAVLGPLAPLMMRWVPTEFRSNLWSVLSLAFTGTFSCWVSVVLAVGYLRLRRDKEGIPVGELATVFD